MGSSPFDASWSKDGAIGERWGEKTETRLSINQGEKCGTTRMKLILPVTGGSTHDHDENPIAW